MPIQLFDASDSENDDISQIKVNEEYARRLEHNKKREDLQRLDEFKKKGLITSSSSSEGNEDSESESDDDDYDHDENLIHYSRSDKEFFDVLMKVKKKDPTLKQKDVKFFESDHSSEEKSDEEEKGNPKDKGKKAMYLKDVVAKQLIEEGPDFVDEEEEINGRGTIKSDKMKHKKAMHFIEGMPDLVVKEGMKTYDEEQEELKKAFLDEAKREGLEDIEGEFLTVKEKAGEDREDSDNGECLMKLDEYFGGAEELNQNFIRDYFMNKMWIYKKGKNSNVEEELQDLSEEEEIERCEEYEHRYPENCGDRVLGHARKVEGSVRKKTNARKEQRKSKEERMAIVQKEREEELKHLKNLKKQEIQEKLKKIKKTAGLHDDDIMPLTPAEIEDEFDPEEYDRMMKKAFDEKYYDAEDADSEFGNDSDAEMEKPDFEKEDELLGIPEGWDVSGSDDGFIAARERALKQKVEGGHELSDQDTQEEVNEEKLPEEGKRKRKHKTALLEKARQAMMDEYYKLDYEDTIGDLKTRFKYAKTKPNRYGLSAAELLVMDEKELNQYISLKKLVPYRDEEWKLSNQKRYQLKMRTREILRGVRGDKKKEDKKEDKKSRDDIGKSILSNGEVENGKGRIEESKSDADNLPRKGRRKQRIADQKLSRSRLLAYGKIPSNSQGRAKRHRFH